MFEGAFVILAVLYVVVAVKLNEWITISALGLKSLTPEGFLRKPKLYGVVRSSLFISAWAVSFGMDAVPRFIVYVILVLVWVAVLPIGQKKAFNKYRQIAQEMMASAETPDKRSKFETHSKRTNQELMDQVQTSMKYGI